jgi:hypothetical protein
MVCVFVKLACKYVLVDIKEDIAEVTSPCQFAVSCKGGCESLQWAPHVAMEAYLGFAQACNDAFNDFNELEREAMQRPLWRISDCTGSSPCTTCCTLTELESFGTSTRTGTYRTLLGLARGSSRVAFVGCSSFVSPCPGVQHPPAQIGARWAPCAFFRLSLPSRPPGRRRPSNACDAIVVCQGRTDDWLGSGEV